MMFGRKSFPTMSIDVLVAYAKNLPNVERFGKSDPYVAIAIQGIKKKTQVKESTLDPVWNETLVFDLAGKLPAADEVVEIHVKDYEKLGRNRLLGSASMSLRNLLSGPQEMEMDLNLLNKNSQPTNAILHVKVSYKSQQTEGTGGVAGGGGGQDLQNPGMGGAAGFPQMQMGPRIPMPVAGPQLANMAILSSTKPEKFQVRVRIVEGRQLQGSNLYPSCRVQAFKETRNTSVCRATSSPVWNELFFFHITAPPADIIDDIVQFEVFHSKNSRSKAVIGSFKCDISTVYGQQQHAFINKWLMLSDTNDLAQGITGYLKVSIAVLGPGDECPDLSAGLQSDQDDVEGNLLWPAGVQLRPATFSLDVYRGEDLPRMDSGFVQEVKKILDVGKVYKELVDPYCIFAFAGKEIQTRILYNNDHPDWRQKLNVGFMFPSMCNNLKLILLDWDRLSDDDVIATAYIPVPQISAAGENGFLPTFGPCFVNFYGAPREYKNMGYDFEDGMNSGKVEGCAYRGRVFVSLRTDLGNFPSTPTATLEEVDCWKVEAFGRRRRFLLNAVFVDATMIQDVNMPIEFEVSIGNFGNKFENTSIPSPSSTQPTNAVFDGCQYYFLPWMENKPSVSVQCQWEDIAFRLEAVNLMENVLRNLSSRLAAIKNHKNAGKPMPDLAVAFVNMIDQLIADCSFQLPEPEAGTHPRNELDVQLATLRRAEIDRIIGQAKNLRENATDLDEAILESETYLDTLRQLTLEPQASIPDVIIWMVCGQKRLAYRRIPANQILFSSLPNASGKFAGQLQTIALKYPGRKQPPHLPVLLRMKLWFGLEKYSSEWLNHEQNIECAIFAETYENQVNLLGSWTTKGPTMSRPPFSDEAGVMAIPRESFNSPLGWRFEGDWFVDPETSMLYDADAGHRVFMEDVFENQNRLPGGNWVPAITHWTDVRGDPATPRDEIVCPEGWEWDDGWKYDIKRAVDEEGWEYTLEATLGGYTPVEKTYHLCRRRRWVRRRYLRIDAKIEKKSASSHIDGWEYAALFMSRYHVRERKMDLVRRRRWHRKMVAEQHGIIPIFNFGSDKTKENVDTAAVSAMSSPRMYIIYKESHKYQLRVYIYQARDLLAGDKTGFSDPYVCISFLSRSQTSEKIKKTLCPTWDQSLIFEEIILYGDPSTIKSQPPSVLLEIFDHDAYGEPDFLGRTSFEPTVYLETTSTRSAKLTWHTTTRGSEDGGEVLACAELFLDEGQELPFPPPKVGELFMVPSGIRPILQRTVIEILCWGVRNLGTYEYSSISSPSIEIECGNQLLQTKPIKQVKSNPNFESPLMVVEMMLPKEELYMPPVNFKLRDHRSFGRSPIVGTHIIKSLHEFHHVHPKPQYASSNNLADGTTDENTVVDMDAVSDVYVPVELNGKDDDVDWWSKYYASVGEHQKCLAYLEKGYDVLEIFPVELERVVRFKGFRDFLTAFPFIRGKSKEGEGSEIVGELKGTLRVYPVPGDPSATLPPQVLKELPSSLPEEVIVRVYIVQAHDLAPKDTNCLADPYVEVKLGKKELNSRDNYKPNTLSPIFGQMFEITTTLPLEKDLRIRVYDYDHLNKDDLIGETVIDLEDRRLTRRRATCGLPRQYHISGPNQWRDAKTPKQILEDICRTQGLPKPRFQGKTKLLMGTTLHNLRDYEKDVPGSEHLGPSQDRLALYCLNTLNLVPEHVETRRLFNPAMPELEQGKLEMWVDIFPKSYGEPGPAVNITPRTAIKHEVRCIIYNTADVVLQEENIVGEKMSDIYVKGWICGVNEIQKTDVHYRSLDGEGNFNWRFVFPMDYMPAEQMVVVKKKEHIWSLDEREGRLPPKLCIQIWDNDKFSFDDFLGELELNLVAMPQPAKSAKSCDLQQLSVDRLTAGGIYKDYKKLTSKTINLFEKKRVYGFWPCVSREDGQATLAGKIEMEIEILTEEEAKLRPAGRSRDDPNANPHLEPPDRPATSFLWLTSPWKSFKFVLWKRYKWYIITVFVIVILVIFFLLFLYNIPEATIRTIFGR